MKIIIRHFLALSKKSTDLHARQRVTSNQVGRLRQAYGAQSSQDLVSHAVVRIRADMLFSLLRIRWAASSIFL
jgi:hypothetical protein